MAFLAGLSGFWIGVFLVLGLLAAIISTATRSYWWATGFVIVSIAFLHATGFDVIAWTAANIFSILLYTGIYIAIGFGWATLAWFIHLQKLATKYQETRAKLLPKFLTKVGATELTPDLHGDFRDFIENNAGTILSASKMEMSASILTGQVILWPFKAVSFFLGDAITWLVRGFMSLFGGFFARIQKWVFRKFPELHA